MQDSRQQWLDSLTPHVRAEVEAEISDYEDPDNAEYIEDGDDWEPGLIGRSSLASALAAMNCAHYPKPSGPEMTLAPSSRIW